jgi:hypothetical protein
MLRASLAGCWAHDPGDTGRAPCVVDAVFFTRTVTHPYQFPGRLSLESAIALDFLRLKHDIPPDNFPSH